MSWGEKPVRDPIVRAFIDVHGEPAGGTVKELEVLLADGRIIPVPLSVVIDAANQIAATPKDPA